jgi:hypothetical protein
MVMFVSKRLVPWLAAAVLCSRAAPALAVQEYPSNPTHRGVVAADTYEIFPENRPGNGVYLQKKLLLTLVGETIRHVVPLAKPGRFAYLAADSAGKTRVGVFVQAQDKVARVTEVSAGFFHAVVTLDGVVYKKLFRVLDGRTVADLLSGSKTADGAIAGPRGVAFYHVSSTVDADAAPSSNDKQFGLQLHVALFDEDQVRHYSFSILNTLPQLNLVWNDADHITYTLADGRSEVLSLSQFQ